MRLHVLADLHFEFGCIDIPKTDADIIVLAGDIDIGTKGLAWSRSQFPDKPVVYVLGNHEFYRHNLTVLTESLTREAAASHIHLLENKSVELGGFKFLGCTLWTDFALSSDPQKTMAKAERFMNDYRIVRIGGSNRVLRARDTAGIHQQSVAWLQSALAHSEPDRTIVVTHHAPSPRSEAPGYSNSPLTAAFVTDLSALIEQSGIPLWIHGHTHFNADYRIGVTRVLTNQRGYPQEPCAGFDAAMVIDV
jgi:Icc-related predicted phosphoesterase